MVDPQTRQYNIIPALVNCAVSVSVDRSHPSFICEWSCSGVAGFNSFDGVHMAVGGGDLRTCLRHPFNPTYHRPRLGLYSVHNR
jgi:hypothetical protein